MIGDSVGLLGLIYYGMNGFCFAFIARRATSFFLIKNEAKNQDDNDPSAHKGEHPARRSRLACASSRIIGVSW